MKLNQKLAQRLLLCLTPLVTGSLFPALPSFAATLAASEATVTFSNFSHNPLTTETQNSPYTWESTNDDQVVARSKAAATFNLDNSNPSQTSASSSSISIVEGNTNDYSQTAKSSARLLGYNFQVGAGETFSFDFSGFLGLRTSVDYSLESANAFGSISFQVYDSNDLDNPLDFFTISAGLNSLDTSDFLDVFKSSTVTVNPNETNSKTTFGGNQEAANTHVTGLYSRFFERTTNLFFREFKSTSAGAACPSR